MDHLDNVPMCAEHSLPAILLTSRQVASAGRQFYKCSQPSGSQCKFFVWADELPSSQPKGLNILPSPTPQSTKPGQSHPEPPSTPTPALSVKRSFSALEEHDDVGASPASLKRMKLIEAALSQPSSRVEEEAPQPGPSTSSQWSKFTPAPQSPYSDIPSQKEGRVGGIFAPKTPTRSQNRLNVNRSALAPSPSPSGTPARQQTGNRSIPTNDADTSSQGTLPDDNLRELTADSIADMLQQLSRVPDYIRKLESSEKKKNAAEKSREAKETKIKNLEQEVERLKAREKQLEEVIAEYECQD